MTPFPRFALRTLPALFLSLGCLAATVQAAEAVRYRFSQAAAPLAQALNAFSRASGQTLLYTAELPPQATAPALHGSLDAEEALQRLLQGSGLRARRIDERTLTLEPIPASGALDLDATTVSAAAPAQGYRPAANASISRGDAPLLEIPQAISVVPAQALQDQRPRNLDDALGNISGITQANTLGGTQDAVMKRGFGDNRDGSIMRDGMPSVQGRNFTATADHVEVLKGPASLLYGIQDPGGVVNVVSKKPQLQQANALTLRGSAYAHGRNGSGGQLDSTGPLDIPRSRRLDEPFNITEGRSELTRLDLERQLDDTWKAHFGYGYSRETYDDNQARVMAVNADGTLTRRMDGTHGAVSSDSFATLGLSGTLQLAGMQHDLQFGMDHEKRKIFRADLLRDSKTSRFDYLDPVYGQVVPSTRVVAGDSDQTDKLRSDSLYFQDSIHLDERWILVGGARYQIYDQLAGRGRPFNANTDINGQKWVPRGGLVYRLSDEVSLYGSYTRSFKPNSTIAPLSTGETIDSAILPEEATSWELGAKLDVPGRLSGTLALFDIRKKNVLVNELDGAGNSSVRAAGRVRSRGLELDLTGQLSERWSLIGSYAWLAAEVTEDPTLEGKRLQNVARNTASLSAVYELGQLFGGDRLRLGGGARYVGKRPGDPANSFDLPSYTVADAFASYDTRFGGHGVKFQLNVKNLFDRTYYPSSANRLYVAMGEPRQFQVSTTVEF